MIKSKIWQTDPGQTRVRFKSMTASLKTAEHLSRTHVHKVRGPCESICRSVHMFCIGMIDPINIRIPPRSLPKIVLCKGSIPAQHLITATPFFCCACLWKHTNPLIYGRRAAGSTSTFYRFAQPFAALLIFWLPKSLVRYTKSGRHCASCAASGCATRGSLWMWYMSTVSEHFSRLRRCSGV